MAPVGDMAAVQRALVELQDYSPLVATPSMVDRGFVGKEDVVSTIEAVADDDHYTYLPEIVLDYSL